MQRKRKKAVQAPTPSVESGARSSPAARAASDAKTPAKAKRTFGISIYKAWCKRCGICAEFCPSHALICNEEGEPFVAGEEKCCGCLQCMHRCPDFCVEVYERVSVGGDAGPAGPGGAERGGP
jgi:2-oxoglutarate ferredoxin oxidoreductase subunit delta